MRPVEIEQYYRPFATMDDLLQTILETEMELEAQTSSYN